MNMKISTLSIPLAVTLVLFAMSCADEPTPNADDAPVDDESTATLAACNEADFEAAPFQGPYFDEAGQLMMPLPESYVVATTAGWVKSGEQYTSKFDDHMGPVIEDVSQRDGMIGLTMGMSEQCGSARTLSVWRDEAALYEFVFGDAHGAAMGIVGDSMRGWETTHWTESSTDAPTWQSAKAKLDDVRVVRD